MSEFLYRPVTSQMSARRKALAPDAHNPVDPFSQAVFAEGALRDKTKQLTVVAAAHATQSARISAATQMVRSVVCAISSIAALTYSNRDQRLHRIDDPEK